MAGKEYEYAEITAGDTTYIYHDGKLVDIVWNGPYVIESDIDWFIPSVYIPGQERGDEGQD